MFYNRSGNRPLIYLTTEEIKKIVDDERAEQLTALLCRHWEVATQRLDTLALEANQRDRFLIDLALLLIVRNLIFHFSPFDCVPLIA